MATLLLGITATLVATRYCKFKSGLVFVVPEVAPSWEKTVVIPPPGPPPPPPFTCTTVVYPSSSPPLPPLPPPATPPTTPVIPPLNTQKLDRPSGPWHPLQRRNPPRIVQSASKLPHLLRLPARRPGGRCRLLPMPLPRSQPVTVFVEIPGPGKIPAVAPPEDKLKPCQPRPTKSADGLNTPAVPHDRIRYPLPPKPHWYSFSPPGRIRGTPSTAPIFLLVVPHLVPIIKPVIHVHIVIPSGPSIGTFVPSAPQPGRLQVEPCGGFRLVPAHQRPRFPRDPQWPGEVRAPAVNPRQRFGKPPLPLIIDLVPQGPVVRTNPPPEGSPEHPEPVEVTVVIPPAVPIPLPPLPPPEFHIHLPPLPIPTPQQQEWPRGHQPQIPARTRRPDSLPHRKNPRIKKPSPHPRRRGQSGYLTSTLGGPWWKKGQKPPVVETSDTPERYYAPFYMERVDVPMDDVPEVREGSRERSKSRERSESPGHGASSREPTPGPGHYNPEHPAIRGRIPGRVPGFPKIPRDENIRL